MPAQFSNFSPTGGALNNLSINRGDRASAQGATRAVTKS
jgi:hypothetical protein